MITPSDRRYHRIYEALPHDLNDAIDAACTAARAAILDTGDLREHGIVTPGDDRAEVLVAAITRYLIESNPEDAAIKAAIEEVDAP